MIVGHGIVHVPYANIITAVFSIVMVNINYHRKGHNSMVQCSEFCSTFFDNNIIICEHAYSIIIL